MAADWWHRAACRDEDPELFYPVGTSGPALLQIAEAKTVCRRCPVSVECLNWALASGQDAGVWGGMSEDERRALKRSTNGDDAKRPRGQRSDPPEGVDPLTVEHLMAGHRDLAATDAERREAGLRLVRSGLSTAKAAARVGVVPDTVRRWARQAGLSTVPATVDVAGLTRDEVGAVVRRMAGEGWTDPEIGQVLRKGASWVWKLRRDLGIPPGQAQHGSVRAAS